MDTKITDTKFHLFLLDKAVQSESQPKLTATATITIAIITTTIYYMIFILSYLNWSSKTI